MKAFIKATLLVTFCAALLCPPALSQTRPRSGGAGGTQSAGAARPLTLEQRRARYVALLQLRDSLRKYLATLTPGSADYQETEGRIRDAESKIGSAERTLLQMFASGAPVAPAPAPPPRQPAEVATPPAADETRAEVPPPPPADNGPAPADPAPASPNPQERAGGAQGGAAATASPAPDNFVVWLNNRVEKEAADQEATALINQGSNANQTETPSAGDNSTSLVDQSSASDLIGVGLNLAGLTNGGNASGDKNSSPVSVTASAFSLYAALKGADPLDPVFYNQHQEW